MMTRGAATIMEATNRLLLSYKKRYNTIEAFRI